MSNTEYKAAQVKKEYPQFITTIVEDRVLVEYSSTESMHYKKDVPLGMILATIEREIEKATEDGRELYEDVKAVTMLLTPLQIETLKHHLSIAVAQTKKDIHTLNMSEKYTEKIKALRTEKREKMMDALNQVLTAVYKVK